MGVTLLPLPFHRVKSVSNTIFIASKVHIWARDRNQPTQSNQKSRMKRFEVILIRLAVCREAFGSGWLVISRDA